MSSFSIANKTPTFASATVTGALSVGSLSSTGLLLALAGIKLTNGATLSSGAGVPAIAGSVGDAYIRDDTPGTVLQRLYMCTVAGGAGVATWVATAT